jgi:hypothetical protein
MTARRDDIGLMIKGIQQREVTRDKKLDDVAQQQVNAAMARLLMQLMLFAMSYKIIRRSDPTAGYAGQEGDRR